MRFADLLRELRVKRRVGLRALSQAVGLSPVYLSDLERGHRRPPAPAVIGRIAAGLGVDPRPLLRAALAERESIELPLSGEGRGAKQREAALALLRHWDELSDEELDQIRRLVTKSRGEGP